MKKIIVILICLFIICGCSKEEKPKCIKTHIEIRTGVALTGKTIIPISYPITICDEYEVLEDIG